MRALKPAGALLNSDDPSPVSEVIMTMVMGEPDAAAPATPTGQARDADARGAGERRQPQPALCLLDTFPMVLTFPPQKCHPIPKIGSLGIHARSERCRSGRCDLH